MNDGIVIGSWWTPNEVIERENAHFEQLRDEWGDDNPNEPQQNRPESRVTGRPR